MNGWTKRFWLSLVVVAIVGIASTAVFAGSQEREDAPKRDNTDLERRQMTLLGVEAGKKRNGARITNVGNVRTTMLIDDGRNVKVIEDPEKGITVEIIELYGAKELQGLKEKYPELQDYIDLFPQKVGNHEIELQLSLKKKFQAPDATRLKIKSLFAHTIYQRHVRKNGNHLERFRK